MPKNLHLRKQMELSKFTNGDKKAIVERADYTYTVSYYLKGKVIKKEVIADYAKAEDLAEDYVLSESDSGPSFLTENGI
jgi:hypothetical protein